MSSERYQDITYEQFCGRHEVERAPVEVTHLCLKTTEHKREIMLGYNNLYVDITIIESDFQDDDDGGIDYHTTVTIDITDWTTSEEWSVYTQDLWRCGQLRKLQKCINRMNDDSGVRIVRIHRDLKMDIMRDILRYINLPITRRGKCHEIYKFD